MSEYFNYLRKVEKYCGFKYQEELHLILNLFEVVSQEYIDSLDRKQFISRAIRPMVSKHGKTLLDKSLNYESWPEKSIDSIPDEISEELLERPMDDDTKNLVMNNQAQNIRQTELVEEKSRQIRKLQKDL